VEEVFESDKEQSVKRYTFDVRMWYYGRE
jgi:hypothetical protein